MSKTVAYTIAASALIGLFVAHAMPQASENMETSGNAKALFSIIQIKTLVPDQVGPSVAL